MNLSLCASLVLVSNPSLLQSSYCSVTVGRCAVKRGRDLWLESISLTPEPSASFFCQKAKNIIKRASCAYSRRSGGGVCPGTQGDTGTGRGKLSEGIHICTGVLLPEVSGSCLQLVSLMWNCWQAPADGGFVAPVVTCTGCMWRCVHHCLSVMADGSSGVSRCSCEYAYIYSVSRFFRFCLRQQKCEFLY